MIIPIVGEQHGASWLTHGNFIALHNSNFKYVKDSESNSFWQEAPQTGKHKNIVVSGFMPQILFYKVKERIKELNI